MCKGNISEQDLMELLRTVIGIKHQIIEVASSFNLTLMQAITLLFLDKPKTTLEISTIYKCDASNISGIVEGLLIKGLIIKKEDSLDRRIKYISLTTKGLNIRKKIISKLRALLSVKDLSIGAV